MESQVFSPDHQTLHSRVETCQGKQSWSLQGRLQNCFQLFPSLARQFVELKFNFPSDQHDKVGRGRFVSAIYNPNFKGGVALQDCSEDLTGRVKIAGEYNNRECGLEITNLTQADSGVWECEVGQGNFH